MRKIVQYLMFSLLGVLTTCSFTEKSEIISIDDDNYIENILNEADQNTLVIFDCDLVLIMPKDVLFLSSTENAQVFRKIKKYLIDKIGVEAKNELLDESRKQWPMKLVNKNFPNIIQNLQAKGVRVLLLTAMLTGKVRNIEWIEDLRKSEMESFSFNFKKSWKDCPNFTFEEFPTTIEDWGITCYPKFEDGMIFTCEVEKGVILKHFLKRSQLKFSKIIKIIFIDDGVKNVRSVFDACQELKIPCTCIEYTKVKHMKIRTTDFETERKRFEDFIKTKQWKSDPGDLDC